MSSISDAPTTDAQTTDAPTQSSEIDPSIPVAVIVISIIGVLILLLCFGLAVNGIVICMKRKGMTALLVVNCIGLFVPIFGLVGGSITIHTKNNYTLKTLKP